MITDQDYEHMVSLLVKDGGAVHGALTPKDCHLIHMAIGVSSEAGELLDCVKKHVIYRTPLDRDNMLEELGDMEFYAQGLRTLLGMTRDEVLEANRGKLMRRYEARCYSDKEAIARKDKQ